MWSEIYLQKNHGVFRQVWGFPESSRESLSILGKESHRDPAGVIPHGKVAITWVLQNQENDRSNIFNNIIVWKSRNHSLGEQASTLTSKGILDVECRLLMSKPIEVTRDLKSRKEQVF